MRTYIKYAYQQQMNEIILGTHTQTHTLCA